MLLSPSTITVVKRDIHYLVRQIKRSGYEYRYRNVSRSEMLAEYRATLQM